MKIPSKRKFIYQLIAACLILTSSFILFIGKTEKGNQDIIHISDTITDNENSVTSEEESQNIIVEIAGQVNSPSVYILKKGSRVYEGIEAAGGLTEQADTRDTNLAAPLEDGIKLYIPSREEVEAMEVSSGYIAGSSYIGGSTELTASPDSSKKINLNKANLQELQQLNGIGPSTAQKIIDYRNQTGPFKYPEDLMNVSGIGEKTYKKLKDYITVE